MRRQGFAGLLSVLLLGPTVLAARMQGAEAGTGSGLADLDRILAEHPEAASAGDLRRMRDALARRPEAVATRDGRMPFDRRRRQEARSGDHLLIADRSYWTILGTEEGSGRGSSASLRIRVDP